jgi:hypothetical protein
LCLTFWLNHPPRSVLDGFGYLICFNYITVFQVGDGTRQFQYAVKSPGGEVKLFHSRLKQALGVFFRLAEVPDFGGHHFGVTGQLGAVETLQLSPAGGGDADLNILRSLPEPVIGQLFIFYVGYLNEYIDPVKKGPADAFLVT